MKNQFTVPVLALLIGVLFSSCTGTLNNMNAKRQDEMQNQYGPDTATVAVQRSTRLTQTSMHAMLRSPQEKSPDGTFSIEAGFQTYAAGSRYKDGPIACKAGSVKLDVCFDCGNGAEGYFPSTINAVLKPGGSYSLQAESKSAGLVISSVEYTLRDKQTGAAIARATAARRSLWNP